MRPRNRRYVMSVAMPTIVRLALDELRSQNPYQLDEELDGDVVQRGVKSMLDEDEPHLDPSDRSVEISFKISSGLDELLKPYLDGKSQEERERVLADLLGFGFSTAESASKLLK